MILDNKKKKNTRLVCGAADQRGFDFLTLPSLESSAEPVVPTKPIKGSWKYQRGLCSGKKRYWRRRTRGITPLLMNCQILSSAAAASELRSKISLILDQLAFSASASGAAGILCVRGFIFQGSSSSEHAYKCPFSQQHTKTHAQPVFHFWEHCLPGSHCKN